MASNDLKTTYTPREHSKLRLRALVEAQLWNDVAHAYTVPELAEDIAGEGVAMLDVDGRVIGLSSDLIEQGFQLDRESPSYLLAHPNSDLKDPASLSPSEPEVQLTEKEVHQAELDMLEWRRQFDPAERAKAKAALWRREHRALNKDPGRAAPHQPGRPLKYSRFGGLLKFQVPKGEQSNAQPVQPVQPTSSDGQVEPE